MKQPPVFRDDDWGELPDPRIANPDATGFGENWQASLGQTIDEGLFVSEYIHSAPIRERNKRIHDLIKSEEIPREAVQAYRRNTRRGSKFDYNGLAEFAKSIDSDMKTDAELKEERDRELGMRRDYAKKVFDNATTDGVLGQIAGAVHASALDPALYPGYFFGPTAAIKATTSLRAFGQGATKMGGFVGAEEALIQSQVMDWKEEIGVEYTNTEAAMVIGGATLFGGLVGGFASLLGRTIRGDDLPDVSKESHKMWAENDGDAATKTLVQMEMEYLSAPDPNMPVKEFTANMDETELQINEPKPFYARKPDEVQPEAENLEMDEMLNSQIQEYEKADMPELYVPREAEDGKTMDVPLRQELEIMDAQEQRMVALKDCLTSG